MGPLLQFDFRLAKAFDTIYHDKLWEAQQVQGVPGKIITTLKICMAKLRYLSILNRKGTGS